LLTITLFLSWLLSGSATAGAELPSELAQGVAILSEYKSSAEQHARILIGLADAHDITRENYRMGQSLYAEAKGAFDGWIDQLIFKVQSPNMRGLSNQYAMMQEKAQGKGDAFITFVRRQFLGRRGDTADAMKSVFASMKEVGQSIWNGVTQVSAPDRILVMERLQGYKWSPFQGLEQKP
jgi:hypothetical protein